MSQQERAAATSFEYYGAYYRRFGGGLMAALRREVYGGDQGQAGWQNIDEQAEQAARLRLGPGDHVLDVGCGSGGPSLALVEMSGCRLTGLDVEADGIAYAQAMAGERGLADRADFGVVSCAGPLPMADQSVDVVLCIDAVTHIPDRFGTLREWARLLRPGGRLLFTDACVLTGELTATDISVRAANGTFVLVPEGLDEAAMAAAGLTLVDRDDRTGSVEDTAGRWLTVRSRHAAELRREEGAEWFATRQRFLEMALGLAATRRLSRFVYLAEKPA